MNDRLSDRLAPALADRYRLERELGAGGMATVWLAHDLKHERDVALKVLHEDLGAALGPERFLAEIKVTAKLQHPHILPLLDSGAAGSLLYYVMPYVRGETLRSRLEREHQLPLDEALAIVREVADALEHAHRQGIVHRDIKPENILLQDGHALVADFGIALAVQQASNARMTQTGLSLGTPQYMSPEQAMGEKSLDARADVYALGAVAYEMLAGDPPFTGSTAQAIVAKVLSSDPERPSLVRKTIPPHVEAAVLRALAKLPADRFAGAAGFATALATPGAGATLATASATAPVGRARLVAPLAAVAVAALALAGWALLRRPAGTPRTAQRYALAFAPGQESGPGSPVVIAPDGSSLVYRRRGADGQQSLWRKTADRWDAAPLPNTQAPGAFAISPDGGTLAFLKGNQLYRLGFADGIATRIADSVAPFATLAWIGNDSIAYPQEGRPRTLRIVPAAGGPGRTVPGGPADDFYQETAIPGSPGMLLTECLPPCGLRVRVHVLDRRTGTRRLLASDVSAPRYEPVTDHVIVSRLDGTLLALPFDRERLEPRGALVPVLEGVRMNGPAALYSLSESGALVARLGGSGASGERHRMVWMDRTGREAPVDSAWTVELARLAANQGWSLSPDGTRLAIGLRNADGNEDIWVRQLPAGPTVRLTTDSTPEFRPRWTPDGASLLFGRGAAGPLGGLFRRAADGTGAEEALLTGRAVPEALVSRDGRWLVVRTGGAAATVGARDAFARRLGPGADTALVPLLTTRFDESELALAPDGRTLAYVSDESGRPEVYVRPFPDVEAAKVPVSTAGGVSPVWSRDGRELFFLDAERRMVSVAFVPGGALRPGPERRLFTLDDDHYPHARAWYPAFDVAADGRFLLARRVRADAAEFIPTVLITDWPEELRRRLGGGR